MTLARVESPLPDPIKGSGKNLTTRRITHRTTLPPYHCAADGTRLHGLDPASFHVAARPIFKRICGKSPGTDCHAAINNPMDGDVRRHRDWFGNVNVGGNAPRAPGVKRPPASQTHTVKYGDAEHPKTPPKPIPPKSSWKPVASGRTPVEPPAPSPGTEVRRPGSSSNPSPCGPPSRLRVSTVLCRHHVSTTGMRRL